MSALPVRTASKEPSSFANLDEVRVKHVAFDWVVDFEKKVVRGSVTLDVHASADADKIVLDTRDLAIESVSLEGTPIPAFSLGEADAAFGSSLTIPASFKKDTTSALTISYTTSPTCTALNWLTPAQTSDGTHPYMFSQCEAIHARSLFPCQDTPGNRATYSAKVTAPHPLQVLMSALQQGEAVTEGGLTTTVWSQPVAIASYLVAVVVGFVEKRVISDRVAIWSEPGCVDMAAHDFRDTEKVVKIGEDIVGPYVWGRYDVVSLPGSFPYGGMENPCLTFVSPSIVTGDRSLFCVVAHEVAHSWTGNLVGPETWEDFYLNEGFTMFLERKIMSVVEGAEYFDLDSEIGLSTLKGTIESLGEDNPFTALRPALVGVDPDDSFSSVPYEKGFAFLIYLRDVVGDEAAFDLWLHDYIQDHKHQSITSEIMIAHLRAWFSDAGKGHTVDFGKVDWAAWLDAPGMPPVIAHKPSPLAQKAKDLADQWLGLIEGGGTLSGEEMSGWTSGQTCIAMGRFVTEAKKLGMLLYVTENSSIGGFVGKNGGVFFTPNVCWTMLTGLC